MSKEIRGVLTALSTPFGDDGAIDDDLLRLLIDRSVNAGVDALVAGGGTGEVAAMSDAERIHVFEVVVKHTAGRVPVVANVGALTAKRAIRLAQAAEKTGADVVMLNAPYYEALTIEEITHYFKTVTGSIKIPVMLYNNPGVTGVNLDAETLAGFGRDIPNVQYVKDSSGDWDQALRLIHYYSDDIKLIQGWDSFSFSALLEGAAGVMAGAANVVPDEIVAVVRALRDGDIETARAAWNRVYPVIDALLQLPFSQAVKAGLRLQGVPVGAPREPFLELPAQHLSGLEQALKTLNS
ncbi:dihydrodipicolinate synthase family protein [Pseudarthrobacter scleromae]|uniref:Dihydrodipicolinate synthase family protein n=1 Tax=Pseudarthrobacter scleromae TaxID=158897 RepID=A0ABQ2CCZ3_9MICC|nr:dihydrodipicolinate synthase family protein [Pseudarthrobacter scleromae]GGI76878.1 dihydrodipicolinate synthase family protein [Pseudarthrobacter scleromae]